MAPIAKRSSASAAPSVRKAATEANKTAKKEKASTGAAGWVAKAPSAQAAAAELVKKNADELAYWSRLEAGGVAVPGTTVKVALKQLDPTIPPEILDRAVQVKNGQIASTAYRSADESQAFEIHTLAAAPGVKVRRLSADEARGIDWVGYTTRPG